MDTAQFFDIQALTFDPKLQVRVRINDEQVAQYAECMATEEDMKKFPPVEIFYDGVKYWLADGHHRRAAAEKAGHSKIWASVKSGTHDDALWAAISGNGKQGFGLTKADRQRAIILALKCFPNKSPLPMRSGAMRKQFETTEIQLRIIPQLKTSEEWEKTASPDLPNKKRRNRHLQRKRWSLKRLLSHRPPTKLANPLSNHRNKHRNFVPDRSRPRNTSAKRNSNRFPATGPRSSLPT